MRKKKLGCYGEGERCTAQKGKRGSPALALGLSVVLESVHEHLVEE